MCRLCYVCENSGLLGCGFPDIPAFGLGYNILAPVLQFLWEVQLFWLCGFAFAYCATLLFQSDCEVSEPLRLFLQEAQKPKSTSPNRQIQTKSLNPM